MGDDRHAGRPARGARHGRAPPTGTVVKLFDNDGREVPRGRARKDLRGQRDGLRGLHRRWRQGDDRRPMSTGDVGRFDEAGRLFVEGRDDEMIVSGGENVFPREVEDLLADYGRSRMSRWSASTDEQFGQRLKAFVVPRGGAELTRGEDPGARAARTSPATRSRARSSSWTSCRATRPARSSSVSCAPPVSPPGPRASAR